MNSESNDVEAFVGEIRLLSYARRPQGWVPTDGQLQKISEQPALFALIGTTYGGDGTTTFALPKLESPLPGLQYFIALSGIFPRLKD